MKDIIMWIMLYGVYWFVSCVLGNTLWDLTKIDWINDITRILGPFMFLGITYIILKLKNRTKGNNHTVKISENKFIVYSLKILGICIVAYIIVIVSMFIYAYILRLQSGFDY